VASLNMLVPQSKVVLCHHTAHVTVIPHCKKKMDIYTLLRLSQLQLNDIMSPPTPDEQHKRYIKADVPHYVLPQFLHLSPEPPVSTSPDHTGSKKRECTHPGCDGSGHVNPGRKDTSP